MKTLNLGNSDFKRIIENEYYYVDKSLFVKELLDTPAQVVLLPRPRRFGKTLNLSMLRYYFDLSEPNNQRLFTQLKIWKERAEITEHQGKYPVIYLSFKDAKDSSWTNTYKYIVSEIVRVYSTHDYLLAAGVLKPHERNAYVKILNAEADSVEYSESLKHLSEYLYRFHKQSVVVLVDEYDTPIQAGFKDFYEEVISFMRNLLSGAFKDNSYLFKGVITGILRISKESIFTGLNNVSVYTMFNEEFSDKFGFTESETKQILHDFAVPTAYSLVKDWYNGYRMGSIIGIYNPWSILNYAVSYRNGFQTFWANTSSDDLIKEQLRDRNEHYTREQLLKLMNNETLEKDIEQNFIFTDLVRNRDLLWSLLTFSGYLTSVNKTGRKTYELAIPNYEIKTVFQDIVLNWLNTDVRIKQSVLLDTTQSLLNNEIDKFEQGFKEIIGDTFSYFDTQGAPEKVYQSYVLGLLAIVGDDYVIRSNRESGMGRYDICLIPHDKSKYGVVIEIKQLMREKSDTDASFRSKINAKIVEAKSQIERNKYHQELIDHKVFKIIKLPIIFAEKEPYVNLLTD